MAPKPSSGLRPSRCLGSRVIGIHLETLDHEELLVRRGRRSGLYSAVAVHSTRRGPSLGGCRMWRYEDSRAGVRDALRLSRAMTFKSAAAGLPLGGGKGVVMLGAQDPPLDEARRRDALLDFGDAVAALGGRYVTAEDVGTSDGDMTVIAERTDHVAGLAVERGGSGDPSPWTALGVEAAIRVTCEAIWGTADLAGRTMAVIGLGHVGGALARMLAAGGASLVLADVVGGKRALAEEFGATWAEPAEALRARVDLVAPCALGGVLDEDSVPELRCRAVAGAANNQLATDAVADALHARGILWTPDFVANAGGIINIAVELEPEGYDPGRARERVRAVGDTVRTVLAAAERDGVTPLAAAMALARERLA
jgi:leucine dehydrogenase